MEAKFSVNIMVTWGGKKYRRTVTVEKRKPTVYVGTVGSAQWVWNVGCPAPVIILADGRQISGLPCNADILKAVKKFDKAVA